MKKGLMEIIFILDRSGSMRNLEKETIEGYNSLIEKQRKETGETNITTVLFDNEYTKIYDNVPIADVTELTNGEYFARGMTALLDSVGKTIVEVGIRLKETPEEQRPEKVLMIITTDGAENASKEFTKKQIKEMIEEQQNKYNWEFMFLGANIDAAQEGQGIGIWNTQQYDADSDGVTKSYATMYSCIRNVRNGGNDNGTN